MVTEDEMRRLAFIRHFYRTGVEQSRQPGDLSAFAVLTFHDSVELFLQLAAEHFNESTKNLNIEQYWDLLEPHLGGHRVAGKESIRRLNKLRVNFKHDGTFPSPLSIEGFRGNVTNFFEVNTPLVFDGLEFAGISMVHLVQSDEARTSLEEAQRLMSTGSYKEAIEQIAFAFNQAVSDYRSRMHTWYGGLSVYRGWLPLIRSSSTRGVQDETLKDIIEELAQVARTVGGLQDTISALTLDLDFRRFQRFELLAPFVFEAESGGYAFGHKREQSPTDEECRFCFDFVIDSALRLQEFDFDVM